LTPLVLDTFGVSQVKIYLGGKITKNGWRHPLVKGLDRVNPEPDAWPILPGALFGHDYTGPFFIGCDHGCYHGRNQHGLQTAVAEYSCCVDVMYRRPDVVRACLAAIDKSDLIFAWLPTADAHGTLFELGYAHARGKCIVIATPNRRKITDTWFALETARVYECDTPGDLLSCLSDLPVGDFLPSEVLSVFDHVSEHLASLVHAGTWGTSA
jgi:hypothetical protein